MADLKDLLGTWTMLSWKKEIIATGETVDAHGPDPVGYITYGADGRMHAIVVRRDRPAPHPQSIRIREKKLSIAWNGGRPKPCQLAASDVGYWHKADIGTHSANVRFRG